MRFLKETNIPFIKYSKTAITISTVIIIIGLISIVFVRGLNYGIDFSGGTLLQLKFEKPITTAEIRRALSTVNLENSIIQKVSESNEFLIRVPQIEGLENVPSKITESMSVFEDNFFEIRRTDQVGPKIGGELRRDAILAIISAIVVIGIYISIRFKIRFAIGAVAALIHDVLITLGIFSILQFEISLSTIAAFLTIVGYSLNDTIVLYDRVRENLRTRAKTLTKIDDIINRSINDVLSRTVITSLTTFIVVAILAFAPGEVRIFAIAMIIGVIVGTYSSMYIAGPVVIYWQNKFGSKNKKK
jgi:preprotein translocase subunit SecF